MNAEKIYDSVCALMFWEQSDRAEYQSAYLSALNRLLNENFAANNALRRARKKPPLTETPEIARLTDEVPFEREFTGSILPYGCAGYAGYDDDAETADEYKNKYEYERAALAGCAAYEGIGRV